jgi:serine/threonine protein kinase
MPDPLELFGHPVLGRIGVGAASVIYKVRDPHGTRLLALKHVVKRAEKDQRFLDQVTEEHRIGSPLIHPSIRRIGKLLRKRRMFKTTEVGLLMEYVDAPGLDQIPPPAPLDAVRIFIRIAEGLHAMHERRIVHADMKPTNVLVGDDLVKIIDLGQACEVDTRKDRIQGTPGYIAPEQAHRRRITERTDVYNFGATMYWTLARRVIPTVIPPKSLESPDASPLSSDRVSAPDPLDEVVPGVPKSLAELVAECVQISRGDRPATMTPVMDRLLRVERELVDAH